MKELNPYVLNTRINCSDGWWVLRWGQSPTAGDGVHDRWHLPKCWCRGLPLRLRLYCSVSLQILETSLLFIPPFSVFSLEGVFYSGCFVCAKPMLNAFAESSPVQCPTSSLAAGIPCGLRDIPSVVPAAVPHFTPSCPDLVQPPAPPVPQTGLPHSIRAGHWSCRQAPYPGNKVFLDFPAFSHCRVQTIAHRLLRILLNLCSTSVQPRDTPVALLFQPCYPPAPDPIFPSPLLS